MDARARERWATPQRLDTEKLLVELHDLEAKLGVPYTARDAPDPDGATSAVHVAAREGRVAEVERLFAEGSANPNAVDEAGATPLHYAAARNHTAVLDALEDAGADVNYSANPFGRSALMTAALTGSTEAVDWLLLHGADWRQQDAEGKTALDWAKEQGKKAAAEALEVWTVTRGSTGDVTAMKRECWEEEAGQRCQQAARFMAAVKCGELTSARRLLAEHSVDPCSVDVDSGATGMHLAAGRLSSGQIDMMDVLLHAGARVDETDRYGWTPLMVAAHRGCATAANWLLQHGADWRRTSRRGSTADQTALALATANRKIDAICVLERWILAHGNALERAPLEKRLREEALVAAKEREEQERRRRQELLADFLAAAKRGNVAEVVRLLALEGEDHLHSNSADDAQITALSWAAWFNQVAVMKLLFERGADIERADSDGYTALMGAAASGSLEAVEWLLHEGGADWRRQDDFGRTALQQAKPGPVAEVIERHSRADEAAQGRSSDQ
jgi:ankyrin repeat protein